MIGTNDTQKGIPEVVFIDNLRQIISTVRVNGKIPIVATLPELGFTPLYLKNRDYIKKYNKVVKKLSVEMQFEVCDMSATEDYYVDGVHYTHEGYKVLAQRFAEKILNM
jgi:lysophospholipase L1-like esterase